MAITNTEHQERMSTEMRRLKAAMDLKKAKKYLEMSLSDDGNKKSDMDIDCQKWAKQMLDEVMARLASD